MLAPKVSHPWDRAQHAADRQAKIDALLLETIDVLARLLTSHHNGQT